MKKTLIFLIAISFLLVGCSKEDKELTKYTDTFFDTFDTQIIYLEYAASEEEYKENFQFVRDEYTRLHKLYDNYRTYEGVNNISTVNDMAGQEPVVVDKDLFDLVKKSIDYYEDTLGYTNIAMGSVLEIWHDVREHNKGLDESETILPNQEDLEEANKYTDINSIELDEENVSIYIKDPKTKIDLGSVAKGYATELIAQKLEERGIKHASINAGGNVRTIGTPGDGRSTWGIALQNPDLDSSEFLDVLYIEGSKSVVTSGDYQRFFINQGRKYHHLINPKTLWPENKYNSVSVITDDSGLADILSTALFLATPEEAEEIISNFDQEVGVIWANEIGVENTDNMESIMKSKGAESK